MAAETTARALTATDSSTTSDGSTTSDTVWDADAELTRQVAVLVDLGYPALGGLTTPTFEALVEPLRAEVLLRRGSFVPPTRDRVPFALVVSRRLVDAHAAMPLTRLPGKPDGRPGFVSGDTADIDRFTTIEGVDVPEGGVHLVLDVERGAEFCDVRPNDAFTAVTGRGRTPLTVDEGIALVTLVPEVLEKNHCFSLGASRCGDRRVPALWISGRAPKLGWCWAGNPHSWLGYASAAGRVGPPA